MTPSDSAILAASSLCSAINDELHLSNSVLSLMGDSLREEDAEQDRLDPVAVSDAGGTNGSYSRELPTAMEAAAPAQGEGTLLLLRE